MRIEKSHFHPQIALVTVHYTLMRGLLRATDRRSQINQWMVLFWRDRSLAAMLLALMCLYRSRSWTTPGSRWVLDSLRRFHSWSILLADSSMVNTKYLYQMLAQHINQLLILILHKDLSQNLHPCQFFQLEYSDFHFWRWKNLNQITWNEMSDHIHS